MRFTILACILAVAAAAPAMDVDCTDANDVNCHKCRKVDQSCGKWSKCCEGLVCGSNKKCMIPFHPTTTTATHTTTATSTPTPAPVCLKAGAECWNSGTPTEESSSDSKCCKGLTCSPPKNGNLGVKYCSPKKCVKKSGTCGFIGANANKVVFADCCKGLKCKTGPNYGQMSCQATKSSTTKSHTSTTTHAPTPTCTPVQGYFGPVQLRTEECAQKINNTIVFNKTCDTVRLNETAQWYVYYTTDCHNQTGYQLVNGADQNGTCTPNMNVTAQFVNVFNPISNVTGFEHNKNTTDTFALNVTCNVTELIDLIRNSTEVDVQMLVGNKYLNNNTDAEMITAEVAQNFSIGRLSAFDLYH